MNFPSIRLRRLLGTIGLGLWLAGLASAAESQASSPMGAAADGAAARPGGEPMLVVTSTAQLMAGDQLGPKLPAGTIVYVTVRQEEWVLVPRWNQWLHESHVRPLPTAIAELTEALDAHPTAELHHLRGIARMEQGELVEALADFDAAIRGGLGSSNVFLNRGLTWGRSGDYDRAIADFTEAIHRDRRNPLAYFNRGVLHAHRREEASALADFNTAIELEPTYAEAYNNRGLLYQQRGELARALADFQAALEHRPRYPAALTNRAYVHQEQGNYAAALADYAAALRIAPDAPAALNDLAWLLATCPDEHIRNGEYALRYAERACELSGQPVADYLDTLAAAAAEVGQFDRAAAVMRQALALAPAERQGELRERLALYEQRRAYREPPRAAAGPALAP